MESEKDEQLHWARGSAFAFVLLAGLSVAIAAAAGSFRLLVGLLGLSTLLTLSLVVLAARLTEREAAGAAPTSPRTWIVVSIISVPVAVFLLLVWAGVIL